ncbi:uncharacterized protein LOC117106083 [Anneissia japonica]|uniref:uncharacterized protein LOC117106083 n=1 Tax=Anneissia japonica TaxID=1529436 RepID=UPI0014257B73|nr:uncharacterized protein LOC117106083 [Anneissia japonica]
MVSRMFSSPKGDTAPNFSCSGVSSIKPISECIINKSINSQIDIDSLLTEQEEQEEDEKEEEEDEEVCATQGSMSIETKEQTNNLNCGFAYENCLLQLAYMNVVTKCPQCGKDVYSKSEMLATSITIKWQCEAGHETQKWQSQPRIRNMNLGDFVLCSNILLYFIYI